MKNNTMKRVLAATLSVLTVTGSMPVNVGGFLTGSSAIVANADNTDPVVPSNSDTDKYEKCTFTCADTGVTNIKYNGNNYDPEVIAYSITAAAGKEITFESATKLYFPNVPKETITETGANGAYTYTFVVPDTIDECEVADKIANVTIEPYVDEATGESGTLHCYEGDLEKKDGKYVTDGKTEIEDMSNVKQGTKVTILASTPFEVATMNDLDTEEKVAATGKWDETAGVYALENYYIENDVVKFVGTEHVADFEYTQKENYLYVTDKADNASIKDEIAAYVKGTYQGEVTSEEGDDVNDGLDGDEGTTTIGDVELKNGGEYIYNKDVPVVVTMKRVDELLGWGGNGSSTNDADLTAFEYKITKDGKALNEAVSQGEVTKADYDAGNFGNTGFEKNVEDGTIELFRAFEQGHYEVTITVWGTDNKAAAFNLKYSFDIVSEELTAASFDLFVGTANDVAENDLSDTNAFLSDATWDAENGIWNVAVPTYEVDANGTKYYVPADGDAMGATARLKEVLATGKYSDLTYGDKENGYQVISEQAGTDLYTKYTLKVEVYNANYGGSPDKPVVIEIPWQLVEPETEAALYFKSTDIRTIKGENAKDEESIRKVIDSNVTAIKYDMAKVSYAYLEESKWDSDQDLDALDLLTDGVPTEDGRYKVFLKYDNELVVKKENAEGLDAYDFCYVTIDRSQFFFDFDDTVQNITYGDAVTLNDYTVLDYLGEPVEVTVDEDAFRYTVYNVSDYNGNIGYGGVVYDAKNPGLLNAGTYYVEVTGKTTDGESIANANDSGFYVRVNKKEITKAMVGFITRDYANGKTVYVWNPKTAEGQIIANDTFDYIDTNGEKATKQNQIAMAAVGGTHSAIKPGSYNVDLSIATAASQMKRATLEDIYDSYISGPAGYELFYTIREKFDATVREAMEAAHEANDIETYSLIAPAGDFFGCYFRSAVTYSNGDFNAFARIPLTQARNYPNGGGCTYTADQMAAALVKLGFEGITVDSTMQQVFDAITAEYPEAVSVVNPDYKNYTITGRKLTTAWNITSSEGNPEFVNFNQGEETPAYARLFNGGKLHVAFTRPGGSGETVKSFGVIIDKDGKLAAPANDKDVTAYAAATTALVLDNGYTTSGRTLSAADQKKLTRGANITPTSADTGVWVRPYYVDNDGAAHYGEPMYFTLPEVTQAELQLRVPGWKGTAPVARETKTVDGKEVSTGNIVDVDGPIAADFDYMDNALNKYTVGPVEEVKTKKVNNADVEYLNRRIYYIAAVKNTLDAINDPTDSTNSRTKVTPERFGVILDKNGVVAGAKDDGDAEAYANAAAELKVDDKRFTTTTTSNSNNHGENAYGANITPKDVFTGVWVRPYVDFGNGLIVYAEPVYFESFNDYFAEAYGVKFDNTIESNNKTYKAITVNQEETKFEFYYKPVVDSEYNGGQWYNGQKATLDYSAAGVVVDKADSITDFTKLTVETAKTDANVVYSSRTKANINANAEHPYVYGANLKKTTGKVNVRPFIVIDDNLTLYGPVQSVTFDEAKEGVEYWEVPKG